ncbi:hypothetical protein AGMMS4956_20450 [Bacteroidia bacterium]|nr:hypothetical protein AGMMS4956_20450 [Bacteroidia bacterium]
MLLGACTERVEIVTDNQSPKLVITAFLRTDTDVQTVHLSRSVRYFGGDSVPYISTAQVWLNDQLLSPVDTLPGEYRINFVVEPLQEYTLRVKDGNNEYFAHTKVPHVAQAHRTILVDILNRSKPPFMLGAMITIPSGEQYVGGDMYYNGTKITDKLGSYPIGELPAGYASVDSVPATFFTLGSRIARSANDTLFTCPFDTITLQIHTLNADAYRFLMATQTEASGSSNPLFGGPPANPPSNITGGTGTDVIGCFGAIAGTLPLQTIVLPLSVASLATSHPSLPFGQERRWVDSLSQQHTLLIKDSTATRNDNFYFKITAINPSIRGFDADSAGVPLQFVMKNYNKFYRLDRPNEIWMWGR